MVLGSILLLVPLALQAQEPRVRASQSGDRALWVGEGVTVVVEVLVPGYFSSAVRFQLPDPAGVLLMPPQGHPLVSSETLDGTLYSVQRHELRAWPMRAGTPVIPSFSASFSFKRNPLDPQGQPATVSTEPVPLEVKLPPGAESLGLVISARNLKVQESWNPEPGADAVRAGSAFTRTLTWSAPDVPGMLFPPFPDDAVDGLGIYTRQQLRDREDRGDFTGERRDEISYVCERPGQFVLPEIQFTWFDLDSQQLRTETLPARTFNVVVNPELSSGTANGPSTAPPASIAWLRLALILLLAALLATVLNSSAGSRLRRLLAPFRAVHLQALNPTGSRRR